VSNVEDIVNSLIERNKRQEPVTRLNPRPARFRSKRPASRKPASKVGCPYSEAAAQIQCRPVFAGKTA
jgi:hypothetical protein